MMSRHSKSGNNGRTDRETPSLRQMGKIKYIPLAIVMSLFVIQNFIFNNSVVAAEIIYLTYILTAVIGCALTLIRSCIYGNKLTGKHTTSRFLASNIISGALLLFTGFYGFLLASDVGRSLVVDQVVQVRANLDNIGGAFVLQQPTIIDEKGNRVSLMFLLRLQYLHVGEKYHLRYAEHSGFILTAEITPHPQ